jgi:hypothetical protein
MNELTRKRFLVRSGAAVGAAGIAGAVGAAPASANPGDDIIGTVTDDGGQVFNVKAHGAKGDGVIKSGGSISSGSSVLTMASGTFSSTDVTKVITVQGAGASGAVLATTISAYTSPTQVTLAASAGTTVSGAEVAFGTNDTTAINAAITAAAGHGRVLAPPGIYMLTGQVTITSDLSQPGQVGLLGAGGRCLPTPSAAATIFLCAASGAGVFPNGWALCQGFLCHGNNIATAPLVEGALTGGVATNGGSYSTFIDVWSTASTQDGWSIYGSQNNSYYDCGTTNNKRDGLYIDGAAGGLDFWRFTEQGSARYGVRGDISFTGSFGTYTAFTANVHFFGGELVSDSSTASGTSKIFNRGGQDWKFLDMAIRGDHLTGPTVDLGQGAGTGSYGFDFTGSTISAPTTGGSAGGAGTCISVTQGPFINTHWTFLKTEGVRFLSGDYSVYLGAVGYYLYSAIGWVSDDTTHGPAVASGIQDVNTLLLGRTGPWQTASLSGSWSGTVKYRVRSDGLIEFKGSATCTSVLGGGTLFTLPTGYRPNSGSGATVKIPVNKSTGVNWIEITSAGVVSSTASNGTVVYLDGVAFPTT